jgi:ribonuclease D
MLYSLREYLLKKYQYIKTDSELIKFRKYLQTEKIEILAIDFEAEYFLHQYGEELCLIQIFDGTGYYLIDPKDISSGELKVFLENRAIVKIFYDASSDKSLVFKKYGIEINSILDLMDFVQVLDFQKKGLDSVLKDVLNTNVSQKNKYQKYNWTKRPIQKEALEYALGDVEYLFVLKDALMKMIIDRNLYEMLILRITGKDLQVKIHSLPGIKRKRRYKDLKRQTRERFDLIYDIREEYAKRLNWPPNNVITNENLFQFAERNVEIEQGIIHVKVPGKLKTEIIKKVKTVSSAI